MSPELTKNVFSFSARITGSVIRWSLIFNFSCSGGRTDLEQELIMFQAVFDLLLDLARRRSW